MRRSKLFQFCSRTAEIHNLFSSFENYVLERKLVLGQSSDTLPIAPQERWQIEQQLEESNALINQTELEIEQQVEQLLELEN